MSNINRKGFTLVELLVVIVVIAILVGMLVPAIAGARERARQTQCKKNLSEISDAAQLYANAKDHYPGYVNKICVGDNCQARSWAVVLFPHLGHGDLWKHWRRPGNPAVVQLDVLKCPNDDLGAGPGKAKLSYVVNRNVFRNRMEHINNVVRPSDIESQSTTIMASERLKVGPWNSTDVTKLTFNWKANLQTALVGSKLASEHPDLVIAAFFDGAVKELRISDACIKYHSGPFDPRDEP